MPAGSVASHFVRVTKILQTMDEQALDGQSIKQIQQLAQQLLAGVKEFPDLYCAQPLLYKSKYSYIQNLTFNTLVYCAQICLRSRINELCSQQLLSAILSLYGERQEAIQQFATEQKRPKTWLMNKRLQTLLDATHQHVWLQSYDLVPLLFSKIESSRSNKFPVSRLQRIVLLAHHLSVAVTYQEEVKSTRFADVIRTLVQQCPVSWLEDLTKLLSYPSLIPPGTLIRQQNNQPAMVLSISADKALIRGLSQNEQAKTELKSVYLHHIVRCSGAQKISGFQQVQQWWNDDWKSQSAQWSQPDEQSFPLDKPPSVLLNVQKHLTNSQVDINSLAQEISSEPAFADYLKHTATFSNRNKLPIQQVKHSLMMHGYERANNMLIEQALLLRLNQSFFPLQQDFTQFTRLVAQIGANLAAATGSFVPEQVSNLACFACSGLFTQPALKTRTQWLPANTDFFHINQLFNFKQLQNLSKHALTLCQAWQQPASFIKAIELHATLPEQMSGQPQQKQLAVILGLSILSARQCYFANHPMCASTDSYRAQAIELLSLSESQVNEAMQQGLSQSHCYRMIGSA